MKKNIIFDFGGVLVHWDPDLVYLPYFHGDVDKLQSFYQITNIKELNKQLDCGLPYDIGLKPLLVKFPEYRELIMLWKNAWHKMIGGIMDDTVDILYKLHAKGYNLYGLTNWSAETFPYVYYTYNFFHLFNDIVVSGRENMIKPDYGIYNLCLSRNNLNANESVFIDDVVDNVNAAKDLGIHGIQFTNTANLINDLSLVGINL